MPHTCVEGLGNGICSVNWNIHREPRNSQTRIGWIDAFARSRGRSLGARHPPRCGCWRASDGLRCAGRCDRFRCRFFSVPRRCSTGRGWCCGSSGRCCRRRHGWRRGSGGCLRIRVSLLREAVSILRVASALGERSMRLAREAVRLLPVVGKIFAQPARRLLFLLPLTRSALPTYRITNLWKSFSETNSA